MKRRRVILGSVGVVAAVGLVVAILAWPPKKEPEYGGKKLTDWLAMEGDPYKKEISSPEAAAAVRQIGKRALPWLIAWLRYYEPLPPWRMKLNLLLSKLYSPVKPQSLFPTVVTVWTPPEYRAMQGFKLLGAQAGPAIPELTRIATSSNSVQTRWHAIAALRCIATEPAQKNGTTHDVISAFTRCLRNNDVDTVRFAAHALGELRLDSDTAVPALCQALTPPNRHTSASVTWALGQFEESARGAVPTLMEAFRSRDQGVRGDALKALETIAPEVADKLGFP